MQLDYDCCAFMTRVTLRHAVVVKKSTSTLSVSTRRPAFCIVALCATS